MSWTRYVSKPFSILISSNNRGKYGMTSSLRRNNSRQGTGHFCSTPNLRTSKENSTPDGLVPMILKLSSIMDMFKIRTINDEGVFLLG
jgi:hypothetical protein